VLRQSALSPLIMCQPARTQRWGLCIWVQHHFTDAEREYQKAIDLNPNLALAHQHYSWYLASVGKLSEAEDQVRQAQELDPLSVQTNAWLGDLYFYERDYDRAIVQHKKVLEIAPDYADAHQSLADDYFAKGMCKEALQEGGEYMRIMGFPEIAERGRRTFSTSGCSGVLRERIGTQSDPTEMVNYYPYRVAQDYARLAEKEKALYWLERCYKEGVGMDFVKIGPVFDTLHAEPRFADLLKRMGYPN
jgi:tetratricopeptide (TPR) repeat protein